MTYTNHNYTAAGRIHQQSDGGPQGLSTAVEASELYMLKFDRKFLKLLGDLDIVIYLYRCYVDDINVITPPINKEWSYSSDKTSTVANQREW